MNTPFDQHRGAFIQQWQRNSVEPEYDFSDDTCDQGGTYRLSRCVLSSHEDKLFQGAIIASMSIPWGETKGDDDIGGYYLVWTRDMVQSATALLASGWLDTPVRALVWLAVIQRPDGSFPQNSWVNGDAFWPGLQLDEVAAPILLAAVTKASALTVLSPHSSAMSSTRCRAVTKFGVFAFSAKKCVAARHCELSLPLKPQSFGRLTGGQPRTKPIR